MKTKLLLLAKYLLSQSFIKEGQEVEILSGELTAPPEELSVEDGIRLEDLWFQHHSPYDLKTLKPLSYKELSKLRAEDLSPEHVEEYITDRKETESNYRELLNQDSDSSFLYATIVGFNKMESALDYPGFTYYFKLKPEQLEHTVFELVAGKDRDLNIKPAVGKDALVNCLKTWLDSSDNYESFYDEVLEGDIDPRVEVIIGYEVVPESWIPEEEQRD